MHPDEPCRGNPFKFFSCLAARVGARPDLAFLLIAVCWTMILTAMGVWSHRQAHESALANARTAARHSIGKDIVYRHWATLHGGVYVPVTEETPPSPYLAHLPERDIVTPSGKPLTLMNPAYMTRQVHQLADEHFGTLGHLTSLKPIRPENAPDPWEREALLAFESGVEERVSLEAFEEGTYLRMMRPLIVKPLCVKCHREYDVGDIRGGLSVSVPWAPYERALASQQERYALGYGTIWGCGFLGLMVTRKHFRRHTDGRREAENAILEKERKFRALYESMDEGVALHEMIFDDEGRPVDYRIVDINPAFSRHTGLAAEKVRGARASALYGVSPPPFLGEYARVAAGGEPFSIETWFAPLEKYFGISVVSPKPGEFATVFEDISVRKDYEQQLEHQATHDALTGLPNRLLLADRLQQTLRIAERAGRTVGVLLIDLDRFKVVNDSLGHSRGDELLRQAAVRLTGAVRAGDTVARLGGDEFVVVLNEMAEAGDAGLLTKRIMDALALPYCVAGRDIHLSASVGVCIFPRDGRDHETLLRNADNAMYCAKDAGGDAFAFFSPEMNRRSHEILEMEGDLRRALEKGEFLLHYQPKVDMGTGRITGCEALVRWRHPTRGLVSPAAFIPLAEETGLIVPMGAWVLKEACMQAHAWHETGLPVANVAVNLSARQFRQADLAAQVETVLRESGLAPRMLDLELTESMIMHDPVGAAETMRRLKEIGVGLCLDDFGTGYSSLNYLRRFPVDYLKIDRSFITDVAGDAGGAAVATSVVAIAHSLGIGAVAEGVETWEQFDFLASCRCDALQGFLFSRPLPPEEFAALLKSSPCLVRGDKAGE